MKKNGHENVPKAKKKICVSYFIIHFSEKLLNRLFVDDLLP